MEHSMHLRSRGPSRRASLCTFRENLGRGPNLPAFSCAVFSRAFIPREAQRYVNLAGVGFAEEAAALERRMNGVVESSTRPAALEITSEQPAALEQAAAASAD
jgi:hypothetical protein